MITGRRVAKDTRILDSEAGDSLVVGGCESESKIRCALTVLRCSTRLEIYTLLNEGRSLNGDSILPLNLVCRGFRKGCKVITALRQLK